MPNEPAAERAILGAVLLDNAVLTDGRVTVEPFMLFSPANQLILHAMAQLMAKGSPVDPVTLRGQLRANDALDRAGGAAYLSDLIDGMPLGANVPSYCEMVRESYRLREIIRAAHAVQTDAAAGATPAADLAKRLALAATAASTGGKSNLGSSKKTLAKFRAEIAGLPDNDWVVPGVSLAGRAALVCAQAMLGKSEVVGAAAATVSNGGHFNGGPVQKGRVLIVSLDEADAEADSRLARYGTDESMVDVLSSRLMAKNGVPVDQVIPEIIATMASDNYRLVVIDSLVQIATMSGTCPDSGSSSAWATVIRPIVDAAHMNPRCGTVLIHHAKKAVATEWPEYRDSSEIAAAVDNLVAMRQRPGRGQERVREMRFSGRGVLAESVSALLWNDEGTGYTDAPSKADAAADGKRSEILAFLRDNPDSTTRAVRTAVKGDSGKISELLGELRQDGAVTCQETAKGGGKASQWSLAGGQDDAPQPGLRVPGNGVPQTRSHPGFNLSETGSNQVHDQTSLPLTHQAPDLVCDENKPGSPWPT